MYKFTQKLENDDGMTYEYVDKKNNIYNNLSQGTNIKKNMTYEYV